MLRSLVYISLVFLLLAATIAPLGAQTRTARDTILLGAVVEGKDTIPMIFLPDVYKTDRMLKKFAKERRKYDMLYYNVYKVYPYAVTAADVLKDVDVNLAKIGDHRDARKAYLKTVERELNKRFKGELEDLTISQGQVLVKLIDRQTGKNCYGIIKELKGGFSAVIWQSVALIFNNSLKREYDPNGDDKDMEGIVRELEAANYHQYQYKLQQSQLQAKRN
ncbi:MAG: DUF4294 domain-containing protein [Bacteroidetes bacterium]|nr:DUF4294 domain-containing protein [Bacteroidota bacterium]